MKKNSGWKNLEKFGKFGMKKFEKNREKLRIPTKRT
nr:MAG TPA: hypothetical protein [Caudoviricetes sp.]